MKKVIWKREDTIQLGLAIALVGAILAAGMGFMFVAKIPPQWRTGRSGIPVHSGSEPGEAVTRIGCEFGLGIVVAGLILAGCAKYVPVRRRRPRDGSRRRAGGKSDPSL
jgi:hypothetical protein